MKRNLIRLTLGFSVGAAVMLMALPAFAQKNPDRQAFFGQTHSHTSWSIDAYLIGNHIAGPEEDPHDPTVRIGWAPPRGVAPSAFTESRIHGRQSPIPEYGAGLLASGRRRR
jgi:hypothetical protein